MGTGYQWKSQDDSGAKVLKKKQPLETPPYLIPSRKQVPDK